MQIVSFISRNKLFACLFILTVLIACSDYAFAPVEFPNPPLVSIVVPGKGTFDLAEYPFLDRRVIGLVNLFRDYYNVENLSNASVNDLSQLPPFMTQYFLAFTTYGLAKIADSTPSYRTGYYKGLFNKLIAMMNSSAMEQVEWIKPDFSDINYSDLGNGFRGPTNIMWTGHYALMELLYYDLFRDSRYNDEIKSYMDQWNASLTATTTWDGKPSGGLGRWGVGLIPCEPYIVFIQCNSIPFFAMRLYDRLYDTNYEQASLPGISWWQTNMMNSRGIPVDGYYVAEPLDKHKPQTVIPETYPGPARTRDSLDPKVSAYGSAWITMFYNAMGYRTLAATIYGNWKDALVHYSTDGTAFVVDSYYYPHEFGTYDFVGNVFAYFCSREMGDNALFGKLERWLYSPFEGRWNGYEYSFDTSVLGSLSSFAYPVMNFAWAWGHADSGLADLMSPRNDAFFTTAPFISSTSAMDGLFVYQAYYDQPKGAFVLTVEAANQVVLTFSNFPDVQGVYSAKGAYSNWVQSGSQMQLTLSPGTYSFIIM